MRIANVLQQHGRSLGTISGIIAQPSDFNYGLAQLCSYIFMIGLVIFFAGDWLFSSVFPSPTLRRYAQLMRENPLLSVGFLFLANSLSSQLLSTGAFEVYYDEQLIFSKLQTGELPDINWLIGELNKRAGINGNVRSAVTEGIAAEGMYSQDLNHHDHHHHHEEF